LKMIAYVTIVLRRMKMKNVKKMLTETRIGKLTGRNAVMNVRIINKLKRRLRKMENEG
jgi:hypothetical protein